MPQPVAAVGQLRDAEQHERPDDEDRCERLALVEHVPEPGGDDLEAACALRVLAAGADAAERGEAAEGEQRERRAEGERVGELEAVREHGERERLATGHALRLQGGGHARLVDADPAGREVHDLEEDRERRHRCGGGE